MFQKVPIFTDILGKESKETNEASTGAKNINDSSNIEEDSEKASCNDGNNLEDDEVVVAAKRRRKSPPVQISRQQSQNKEDFNESLETPTLAKVGKGLSLKSASDLEEPENTSTSSKEGNEGNQDMAGSIQAALAALQAGQISLNQVIEIIFNLMD